MLNKNKLRAAWVGKGLNQSDVAKAIGVSNKTFSARMKSGVFGSDEIEKMISYLDIDDPMGIFFAGRVS